MIDCKNGKIYSIRNKEDSTHVYIGTCQDLRKIFYQHRIAYQNHNNFKLYSKMREHTCVCIHTYTQTHTHTHTHIVSMYVRVCVCVYICIYIHTYIHIYIYIYTYIYIYIYIYICIKVRAIGIPKILTTTLLVCSK
jgi:hypothetical protein